MSMMSAPKMKYCPEIKAVRQQQLDLAGNNMIKVGEQDKCWLNALPWLIPHGSAPALRQ
jgi:hypothetical protein